MITYEPFVCRNAKHGLYCIGIKLPEQKPFESRVLIPCIGSDTDREHAKRVAIANLEELIQKIKTL